MRQIPYKPIKSLTINWSGSVPLPVPGGRPIQPGDTTMPSEQFHALGRHPEIVEHIAAGRLAVVHRKHEFADGEGADAHCIGCSMTRAEVEAERASQQPAKKTAAPVPAAQS